MKITFPMTAEANVNMYGDGGSGAVPQRLPSDEELAEIEKQRKAEELEQEKNKSKEKPNNKKAKDSDTDGDDVDDTDGDANEDDEDADDGESEEDDGEDDGGEEGDESDEEEDEDDEATASSAPGVRKIRRVALAADGGLNNVFSGFPGVGKSTVFANANGLIVADSDSSQFDKAEFPDNYLMHIQETRPKVDVLLVSSHNVVRDELEERGIDFHLVYPTVDQKADYLKRYTDRGSPVAFIEMMDNNWEKFIGECAVQVGCTHVVLKPGQFLGDVIQDYL